MTHQSDQLSDFQRAVLAAVNHFCAFKHGHVTSELAECVGRQPGADSDKQHTLAVRRALTALEERGLIGRMDDEYPVVWVRKD